MYLHRKLVHKRQQNVHFTKKYIVSLEASTDLEPHLMVGDGNSSAPSTDIEEHVLNRFSLVHTSSPSSQTCKPLMCVCLCLWQVDLHVTESVYHRVQPISLLGADMLPSPTSRWGARSVEVSCNTIYF